MKKILTLVFVLGASNLMAGAPSKPFELWPPFPGATPAPYTKAAPSYDDKGLNWNFPKGEGGDVTLREHR